MGEKFMHVVRYGAYGGGSAALKHAEVPIPTPGNGEILLKVEATSLNPVDWRLQHGLLRPLLPLHFPFVPCEGIAGKVVQVGRGVQNFKQGDKVVSILSVVHGGGLAEYAIAKANLTVKRPSEVSASEGAGILVSGLTALQVLTKTIGLNVDGSSNSSSKPMNLLITAASGGVGHYAVQIAKLCRGVHVTATCGARNIELVKSLGVDEVLDYKTPDGETLKSPSGRKYVAVIHCGPPTPWSRFEPVLSYGGKMIELTAVLMTYVHAAILNLMRSKKKLVPFLMVPSLEEVELLMHLLQVGKVKTVLDSTYPLAKAQDAWARLMTKHATGKVVVTLD